MKLRYLNERTVKGKRYYYFRHQDIYSRLPGKPGEQAFVAKYAALLEQTHRVKQHAAKRSTATGYIYFMRVGERIKIGYSKLPSERFADLQVGMPARPDVTVCVRGSGWR